MKSNRRGATVVEFAIVAPVLLLFVFGLIEFGRGVMVQQQITAAATAGARAAAFDGATVESVKAAIKSGDRNLLVGVRSWEIQVSPNPPSSATYGQNVSVTITAQCGANSWLPLPRFLASKTLTATATARREAIQ